MLDPVSALSVAAAVFQFLSFSHEALDLCREIRDNAEGATQYNKSLEGSSRELRGVVKELQIATANTNQAGKRLNRIAIECLSLSNDLVKLLDDVRGAALWQPIGATKPTFKAMKESRKIEKLKNAIEEKQALLNTALSHDIR